MLVAKVKLPVAIKRDMFTKLSEEFQCIQENKDSRVYDDTTYDYALDKSIECVTVMNKNEFYIDECEKKDGEYYRDGDKLSKYSVHKRPINDYAVLKDVVVFLDVDKFYKIASNDIRIEIIRVIPVDVPDNFEMYQKFNQVIENITNKIDTISNCNFSPDMHCNVNVPNLGLLQVREVTYRIDFCTEELQEMLNDGWMILAVCPQPSQRRPDYILGKREEIKK